MFSNFRTTTAFLFLIMLSTYNPIMKVIEAESLENNFILKETILLISFMLVSLGISWFVHRVIKVRN